MDEKIIITIARQVGSGGREIGEKIAARLGLSFYDRELIQIAAQKSGLGKEFFEQADEEKGRSLFSGILSHYGTPAEDGTAGAYLSNEALFQMQSNVIRELAAKASAVFIGRCADYVLKDFPHCLNFFISAAIEDRIQRIMRIQPLTEKKARELIEKTDKKRAAYYNYFTDKQWGAADSYHLCINSSVLGVEETTAFLCRFIEKKFAGCR
ncbi:MAG: cytidylate kinase [bacterium ADurb.Bin478]|nr:MAG: cytidylate kinase [bacterium ADurb.Bin478]